MNGQSGYVPATYIPLGQSDSEPENVPLAKAENHAPRSQFVGDRPTRWSSGICACGDDTPSCLIDCLCPCTCSPRMQNSWDLEH
ncbi:unnamed protein product [Linum trigynum]|uniref:Uncharacterized protein n=1 Tax=Linum trigynum TaxID=586398 RepID=A0AAV2D442_9ROSI